MKNLYIAATVAENDKYYSYVIKISDSNNLVSVLSKVKGLVSANVWPKNQAIDAVREWNEAYRRNGTYLFDTPAF